MFPLGHAAFGYLLYLPLAWWTNHRHPHHVAFGVLLVGTQFPDLIDKPLAFAGILPSGRALGHSLFFMLGLFVVLWVVARRSNHPHLAVAFGFGHASHIAGDLAVGGLAASRPLADFSYLLWPLLEAPVYPADNIAPWVRIGQFYASPEFTPRYLLIPLALVAFVVIELRQRRKFTE